MASVLDSFESSGSVLSTFENVESGKGNVKKSILDTFELPDGAKPTPEPIAPVITSPVNVEAYDSAAMFEKLLPKVPKVPKPQPMFDGVVSLSKSDEKQNYIERGLNAITGLFGTENVGKLSEGAKAQALVMHMAKEEGIPLHQYRRSPELVEKAASSFISMTTLGLAPAIKKGLTGEVDYPATDTFGYIGEATGSLAGLYMTPMAIGKVVLGPVLNRIPQAFQNEAVAARIFKGALKDSVLLGPTIGLSQVGEALEQVTFTEAADKIWEGTKSGAMIGTIFGASRGLFPKEGYETGARILTGLIGLNAYRAAEVGGNPFTNRPMGDVLFDVALDAFFLYKGLPKNMRFEVAQDLANLNKRIDDAKKPPPQPAPTEGGAEIPPEVLQKAQVKVSEVEKVQIELEAKRIEEKAKAAIAAKADLEVKGQEVKDIKEGKEPEPAPEPEKKVVKKRAKKQPITDLDLQTGEPIPEKLSSDKHPFRDIDAERTGEMSKGFIEKIRNKEIDPEVFTRYLINEMNQWLNGKEPATPIEKIRNGLSNAATNAENARFKFDTRKDFENWKATVTEAARWARGAERPKPVEIIPTTVAEAKEIAKRGEAIAYHGGRKGIEEFRAQQWFTTDEKVAKGYNKGGEDYKVRIKIENPWVRSEHPGEKAPTVDDPVRNGITYDGYILDSTEHPNLKTREVQYVPFDPKQVIIIKDRLTGKRTGGGTKLTMGLDPTDIIKGAKKIIGDRLVTLTGKTKERGDLLLAQYILPWTTEQAAKRKANNLPVDEGLYFYAPIDQFKHIDKGGTQLNIGVDPTEATKKIVELYKSAKKKGEESRGMKEWKPEVAAKMLKEELIRSGVDRSGNIRKSLLDRLSDEGYRIIQRMYLSKGAPSLAALYLKQMRKETYDGLSKDRRTLLDDIVFHIRILDLAKYKTVKDFKEFEKYPPAESVAFLEAFPHLEGISPKKAHDLYHVKEDGTYGGRAGAYYEWMKKPLKDMLEAELVSDADYNDLVTHNYRRLKVVEIFDKREQKTIGKKIRTVYDSGVESLAHGRDTTIFERSGEVMALEVFNRAYGRILNNAANRTLLDLARNQKENPFVRVKETPQDNIPTGWDRIFVYEKGERKAIYISPEMSKEWITNNPDMSYKLSQFIRYASGSPVLRTFATGIDWGFALANLPRDVMHLWYASRVFEGGKWKSLYSSNLPVYYGQIGADVGGVFLDAVLRRGRYEDYIKEGGGMEFLVHQGRLMQRGRHIEGNIDKVQDFLGYFGETSEILTRLAIRDRVIKRRAAEQGISYEEAAKDKKITTEATFAARDYMDFGQGGGIAKALDNGIPYLNASIQGTRGIFRAFKDNPAESTYKLAQFAALVTGLYVANQNLNSETMKALQGNIDMQGNLVIPLGDGFGFLDEKGQQRYPYFKIPLDPGQKFFKMFFEASTDKMLGNPVDVDGLVNSLSQVSPVAISSLPPTIGGTLGYMYNKDFWQNEDIWKKTDKPLGWPHSKEEYIPGQTPQAMIDLGAATGLSPERMKYALGELVTSGSMWSWLVGQGYDAVFKELPKEKKEWHLAEVLSKTPVIKRFIGITNPYSQFASPVEEAREDSMLKRWIENRGLDQRVESYLYEGGKRSDVIEYIQTTAKDVDTRDRLKDRFEFQEKIKGLPNRSFWLALKGTPDTDARAKLFVQRFDSASDVERASLMKEIGIVNNAGGVISDEFKKAVAKHRSAPMIE